MKKLLEEWAELEPSQIYWSSLSNEWVLPKAEWSFDFPLDSTDIACIQYAAQQAIEAQKWQWNIMVDVAGIYKADLCIENDITDQFESRMSSTKALLSIYIETLRQIKV